MKNLIFLFFVVLSFDLRAAISWANTPVRLHMPTSGSWTPGQFVQWRYTTSRPNAFYDTCVNNTQTPSGFFNLGDVSTHSADACLPFSVIGSVEYRFSGSAAWTNAFGGGQDWYIAAPPVPEASVCRTNRTSSPAGYRIVNDTTGLIVDFGSLNPGDVYCFSADFPFTWYWVEFVPQPINGTTETNLLPIYTWDGTSSETNRSDLSPPRGAPGTNNPSLPNDPSASAIVNQLQDNANENSGWLALIAGKLQDLLGVQRETRDHLTNSIRGPSGSETNSGLGLVQTAMNTFSNAAAQGYTTASNAVRSELGVFEPPTSGAYTPVPLMLGTITAEFDPMNQGDLSTLFTLFRGLLLFAIKFYACWKVTEWLQTCLRCLVSLQAGGTSGWLQAPPISLVQLATTLFARAGKWSVLGITATALWIFAFVGIVGVGATGNIASFISTFPPLVQNAVAMTNWIVPLSEGFTIVLISFALFVVFYFTIFVMAAFSDAANQA